LLVFYPALNAVLNYMMRYNKPFIFVIYVPGILMRTILTVFILISLAACSAEGTRKLPGVYRIDIQQGNVIEQEMLDKLRPGMEKEQVHFIMGTPTIIDPFHNDRWEYLYTYSKGGNRREQRHITIYFDEDKLAYLSGGVVKGVRKPPEEYIKERKTVDVPLRRQKKGFFSNLINVLPFVGDDKPKVKKARPAQDETETEDEEETESGEIAEVTTNTDVSPPQIEDETTETAP
jgi:outer membrane protein assembly factor BamE